MGPASSCYVFLLHSYTWSSGSFPLSVPFTHRQPWRIQILVLKQDWLGKDENKKPNGKNLRWPRQIIKSNTVCLFFFEVGDLCGCISFKPVLMAPSGSFPKCYS